MITYLHPPRERTAPRPEHTAADVLGVFGQRPRYRGGLAAYRNDRRAHRAYRAWKAERTRRGRL